MSHNVLFDEPGPLARRRVAVLNVVSVLVLALIAFVIVDRLAAKGQFAAALWTPFLSLSTWQNFLLPGLWFTLLAAGISIVSSAIFGLVFGLGRLSSLRLVRWVSATVVEFFRAVPVLLMMIFFWLGLAQLRIVDPATLPLLGVVLGLTLYNGSVFAELLRSGVHNLPKGQREAAMALGMRRSQSLHTVEVPQALVAMLPSTLSQLVVILKDTALGYIITYTELLQQARRLGSAEGNILQALVIAAVIFIVINYGLTQLASWLPGKIRGLTAGRTRTEAPAIAAHLPEKD